MNHEVEKLHQLKLTDAKLEVFFTFWVGTALAVLGAVVGTWLTGAALNWFLILISVVLWCPITAVIVATKMRVKVRMWEQEERVQRVRDAEVAFSDKGS